MIASKIMQKFFKAKTSLFTHIINRSSVNVPKPITNARIAKDTTPFKVPGAEIETQLTKLQEVYSLQLHSFMYVKLSMSYVVLVASTLPASPLKYKRNLARSA